MIRRDFLKALLAASAGTAFAAPGQKQPRRLLLRSSWQTVNIGDIGHTPGLLRLLDLYLPEAQVTLWPSSVDNGVEPMLKKAFPKLRIVKGRLDADGKPTTKDLQAAFADQDILVHGSGPSVVAQKDVAGWRKATGKPYGIYGVTITTIDPALHSLLSGAAFVYCRDTISLDLVKKSKVTSPVMEFAPDATFAFHLRDEKRATDFLSAHKLEDRKFLCVIPRLRWTPYYKIHKRKPTPRDLEREAYSLKHRDTDHAKQREAIVAWVRQTGLKVLACPEMTYQVPLAREMLIDPLPDDVKRSVVWRDSYWLPDEAASVYARASALLSFEMHSPIIAAACGTPAIYLRQPTDTSKGQMWRDIGLKDWIFEIDETEGKEIARTVLGIQDSHPAALKKLAAAMTFVRKRQKDTLAVVGRTLG